MLILLSSLLTLFIGVFQILAEPLILSMADASTLGIAETICASGMMVSSLYLGVRGIKSGYVRILSLSLTLAGVFILSFGILSSIPLITLTGFVMSLAGVALIIVSLSILFIKDIRLLEKNNCQEEIR